MPFLQGGLFRFTPHEVTLAIALAIAGAVFGTVAQGLYFKSWD